jgi:rubredoxin
MDEVPLPQPAPQQPPPSATIAGYSGSQICPRCHFPTRPEYYFCPNCGAKLTDPPLGTGLVDQLLLYAFSIILPWIAYLAITKWQGIKYLRAPNSRAKQIGVIALVLLVVSSVIAVWLTTVWIQGYIQQSMNDVNNIGSGLGSF